MSTDDDGFNGSEKQPLHELVETAPVTRQSVMANAFMEDLFDRFAEAELKDDKKFVMDVSDFDSWAIARGYMPNDINESDPVQLRGKSATRNEIRKTINRAAAFGKSVWPPYSIEPFAHGKKWEVRLLEYYAEKLPMETAERTMRYMVNKGTHWAQISAYMHSEPVQKRLQTSPEVGARFYGAESAVRLTFKNAADALTNLNEVINETYREARRLMITS